MLRTRHCATYAGLAAAALALPALASASPTSALSSVQQHTSRADDALARAASLFAAGRPASATQSISQSRAALGQARAAAAKLLRTASTPAARAEAARALRLIGVQQSAGLATLTTLLGASEGTAEHAVAAAALSDAQGRDKALAILRALLLRGVPTAAEGGLAKAIAALSTDRGQEVAAQAEALASGKVDPANAPTVIRTIDVSLRGQARAAALIKELMARLPAAAQPGLARAYDAITAEQGSAAHTLGTFSDRMPEVVRDFVTQVVQQAQADAQSLGTDRPTPPSQAPSTTPTPPTSTGGSVGQPPLAPGAGGPPSETPGQGSPPTTPSHP